nr:MAG TPA: hypothetical protein [Caudoviricetes sp.]
MWNEGVPVLPPATPVLCPRTLSQLEIASISLHCNSPINRTINICSPINRTIEITSFVYRTTTYVHNADRNIHMIQCYMYP